MIGFLSNEEMIQVKDLLQKRISNETHHYLVLPSYKHYYKSPKTDRSNVPDKTIVERLDSQEFDLVELKPEEQENKIIHVYEICTFSYFKNDYNEIQQHLHNIEEITDAKAFIAFLDGRKELRVLSLQDLSNWGKDEEKRISYNNKRIESFTGFYEIVNTLCNYDYMDELKFFFRGHSEKVPQTLPNIYRGHNIEKEDSLFHEAVRRLPDEFTEDMSTFDKLVKMQHYELPTRLLDVTTNPLVALYFACQEAKSNNKSDIDDEVDVDGEVLVYLMASNQIEYYDSEAVSLLANLAQCRSDFSYESKTSLDELTHAMKKDNLAFGDSITIDKLQRVLCVLPKLNNDRINNQDGAFFIFGIKGIKKDSKDQKVQLTKKNAAEIIEQTISITIKAKAKKNILKELKFLGIDEASLFPETDKTMKQIKQEFCKS